MDGIATLILLVLFGSVLLALANGGWPAVRQWGRVKFLGQTAVSS